MLELITSGGGEKNSSQNLQKSSYIQLSVIVVVVIAPPLFQDGGTAQTAVQVHAVNLIELG